MKLKTYPEGVQVSWCEKLICVCLQWIFPRGVFNSFSAASFIWKALENDFSGEVVLLSFVSLEINEELSKS